MNSRNTILDELRALDSALPSGPGQTTYTVPAGYFEGLAASVMARIKALDAASADEEISGLSPLLAGLSRKMPFSVPDTYFQDTTETLASVTSTQEESLILSFISKEMPYQVPMGYFANLPEQVLERVSRQEARVVPLFRKKWMKMAVAAAFTGVMAISGIFYFGKDSGSATPKDAVATELKSASTEELNNFLKTTDVGLDNTASLTKKPSAKNKEVKTLFQDVSDKELEAFLEEIPADELSTDEEVLIN